MAQQCSGRYGLEELAASQGQSVTQMLEDAETDDLAAGICPRCGFTDQVSADCQDGNCPECHLPTVASCMTLAGL